MSRPGEAPPPIGAALPSGDDIPVFQEEWKFRLLNVVASSGLLVDSTSFSGPRGPCRRQPCRVMHWPQPPLWLQGSVTRNPGWHRDVSSARATPPCLGPVCLGTDLRKRPLPPLLQGGQEAVSPRAHCPGRPALSPLLSLSVLHTQGSCKVRATIRTERGRHGPCRLGHDPRPATNAQALLRVLESLEPPAIDKTMSTATDHPTPTLHLSGHSKPCQFPELC